MSGSRAAPILDAHVDLAWNALERNRDLGLRALTVRTHELSLAEPGSAEGMLSWPDLAEGRVAIAIATLRAPVARRPEPHRTFASAPQAHAIARGHLAYYRALARSGRVRLLTDAESLDGHWSEWRAALGSGAAPPPTGLVLALAGADPVLDPEELDAWHRDGVRVLAPAHAGDGRYAGGHGCALGLGPAGPRLLDEAARLDLVLDLAGASEAAFDESLERWEGPVMVSHGACRERTPALDNLDDTRIARLAARGGVLAITLRGERIAPYGHRGRATLDHVVDHVEHVCSVAGTVGAVGLGSDLDDPLGRGAAPEGIETAADLPRLAEALEQRGFDDGSVASILGENVLELLGRGAREVE
jgi:membrane dipeptidase